MNLEKINIIRCRVYQTLQALLLVAITMVIISCEDFFISEVNDIDIPGSREQIVVNSYISPQDSLIRVHVNKSVPYYMSQQNNRPDIMPKVYMGKKLEPSVELTYSMDYKCFVIPGEVMKVEPGYYYTLSVEYANGEKVEAECYVPDLDYENFIIYSQQGERTDWYETFDIDWKLTTKDNSQINYFTSGPYIKGYYFPLYDDYPQPTFVFMDLWFHQIGINYIESDRERTYAFNLNYTKSLSPERVDSLYIYLMQTDANYYHYHTSLRAYENNSDENPFSESVLIYSNIKGGLGVFAGYNRKNFFVQ